MLQRVITAAIVAIASIGATVCGQTALAASDVQPAESAAPPSEYPAVRRVVVIGYMLGAYEDFRALLRQEGLIDEHDNWTGGDAHLVQLGNIFGPGPSLDEGVRLLMKLENQAVAAGGMVHALHGKTEHMILLNDLSRVFRAEGPLYAKYVTENSEAARQELFDRVMKDFDGYMAGRPDAAELRENYVNYFNRQVRPGGAEFLATLAPGTEMGDWLRSRNTVIKIGDYVFCYGGISEKYAETPLKEINDKYRAELREGKLWIPPRVDLLGPLWWSELTTRRDGELRDRVEWIMYKLGARGMVVGHSPLTTATQRGRIIHCESNLGNLAGEPLTAIEIVDGRVIERAGDRTIEFTVPPPLPANEPPRPPAPSIQPRDQYDPKARAPR